MLCQFTFGNYRSYRSETSFTMQSTSMKEFSEALIRSEHDSQSFLPVAAVYGPNAGGKTNLFLALQYVCSAVARPIMLLSRSADDAADRAMANRLPRCSPFAFDEASKDDPTSFEVYYRVKEHEYRYELVMQESEISSEALFRRKIGGSRTATIFEREGANVEHGASIKRIKVPESFNPSIPYLSFLRMNSNAEAVAEAADWFVDSLFLNYNSAFLEYFLEDVLDDDDSDRVARLLNAADITITGFRTEKDDEEGHQKVFVGHRVDGQPYELRLSEESAGTQKLMGLASFLVRILAEGGLLAVDELDAKLHPKLLRYVVLLFKDPAVNKHGAQLIFTSQDVSTMRNDVFRRDEIWFAAKDEHEESRLWSLADIHEANGNLVSKNAAFDKQYLAGRYGADPYLTRMEEWV